MRFSIRKENNPFKPGYGVLPPVLAGRDNLQDGLRTRLHSIRKSECNPTAIVLTGPRGCGKTSLLAWLTREAKNRKLPVVNLTKEKFATLSDLQQALYNQAFRGDRSSKISVHGRIGDPEGLGGLQAGYTRLASHGAEASQFLEELLGKISRKGLVLLVDEAHDMLPEVGKHFYDAAQTVGHSHPILLVIAGTPDLKAVLRLSHATFSERAQIERIGRLTKDEAREAIFEPFGPEISFCPEAMTTVLAETQNYPYFIQLWGKALWDSLAKTQTRCPGSKEVEDARPHTVQGRWELYSERIQELRSKNLLVPIAEMAWRLGKGGQPTHDDFETATQHLVADSAHKGINNPARDRAERDLLHTGFIWESGMGQWEYGIPSLASYVRQEATRLLVATLKGQENVPALAKMANCFGLPSESSGVIKTRDLQAALENLDQDGANNPLGQFQEMKLLVPTASPEHVRLKAPHLVSAIVTEAIKQELLPAAP